MIGYYGDEKGSIYKCRLTPGGMIAEQELMTASGGNWGHSGPLARQAVREIVFDYFGPFVPEKTVELLHERLFRRIPADKTWLISGIILSAVSSVYVHDTDDEDDEVEFLDDVVEEDDA